ncbi:glycosyltransferase family 2 protein [Jannaschia sp. KMU-145]|uniref:glycosyltransferase family 2 protein n=1 Tax=Jannaschia halovivens TaxID=3388667 RepID=UPI00396B09B9
MTELASAIAYLEAQSFDSLLALFWFVAIFELPRYGIPFLLTALTPGRTRPSAEFEGRVSVIIAGHSEEQAIAACVHGLVEQSRRPDEIVVVSDGSSDAMRRRIAELRAAGLIDAVHATDLRSGKSAGTNMAARLSTGQIVINVDCDCSFDRYAIRNVLRPFADPAVAAVCGNILPRNTDRSLIARFQAIEYAISISLGKQAGDRLDQITCVSGAFGAFRRDAYDAVGGLDAGGGEDLDLTLSLRQAGWGIRFAADAMCYTDVPATRAALVGQRLRWERDAVRLRYRKHARMLNPFASGFRVSELVHELEFLLFNVVAAAALPVYVLWLFAMYGASAWIVMGAAQLGLMVLDLLVFILAASRTPKLDGLSLLPDVPGYSLFSIYMRMVRLAAYLQEWIFRSSYADNYVPEKVHRVRG